jgi:hypothetical protein
MNAAFICRDDDVNFPQPVCLRFDPFNGDYRECMWRGLVDTRGIEDPKLFVWPGRGVYAVFNRKPRAPPPRAAGGFGDAAALAAGGGGSGGGPGGSGDGGGGSGGPGGGGEPEDLCPAGAPMLQQFLVALAPSPAAGAWALRAPVPLTVTVPGFYDGVFERKGAVVKEKNWMPLVHEDTLYMVRGRAEGGAGPVAGRPGSRPEGSGRRAVETHARPPARLPAPC